MFKAVADVVVERMKLAAGVRGRGVRGFLMLAWGERKEP